MSPSDWKVPAAAQPKPQQYGFDLERALSAVVSLSATVPARAFTAETLGTERAGNAVLIREDGLFLTIGYLVTEAAGVWLTTGDGRVLEAHPVGIDPESGMALVQAFGRVALPALPLGVSAGVQTGDAVVVAGAGGRRHAVAARVAMKQEFAGYWEYVLDEAIFTGPAHPHWGGTALIGADGHLLGIGSLQLQGEAGGERGEHLNMVVPIDLLPPVLDDLLRFGRPNRAARPWLGLFAAEVDGHIAVAGIASGGPAETAQLQIGDLVLAVADEAVTDLASFFRQVWRVGEAGVVVPLKVRRKGRHLDVAVTSTDRARMLQRPVLH